jgi:hypothetical protein
MIGYKKVAREVEEIGSVKCDKCGREYDADDLDSQKFQHVKSRGRYASFFGDDTDDEYDVRQPCSYASFLFGTEIFMLTIRRQTIRFPSRISGY